MNNFPQMLQSWQPFYTTIATASATLTGLLFVSLSINRQRLDDVARMAARRTFGSLIDVLVIALIFLIPYGQPYGLGIALAAFGLARVISTVGEALQLAKKRVLNTIWSTYARHICLQLIFSSGTVILGIAIYRRTESAMSWPVAIIVALLGSASWNAWEFLLKE
jgi:hypothetical protein